jgi:glycosyltransferase involved in cell wall biosynthesis
VRILYVIQELATGGAERMVASLAEGARRAGHKVAVAAAPGPLEAELLGTRVFPIPVVRRRPVGAVRAARVVASALREWRPDVVHCHNPGMAIVSSLATLRGRRRPALASVHGVAEEDYPAAARALRLAGLPTIACGPGVAAALAEHGLEVAGTIVNGVAPAPPAADRERLANEWALRPQVPLVVTVGRLVLQKNQALAVRALTEVPDAVLVVVGTGPLRAELEREARNAAVADRVVLTGARQDARAVIGAADAVVISSHWEGLPLVALEALSAGRPLVATAVRGLRELLTDGETALLVEPGDSSALAAALRRVLDDPELARRLGEQGRRLAAEHSEEQMIEAFLEVYERLLAGRMR